MKKILLAAIALLMAVLAPLAAMGEVAKPNEDFWYLDEAGVLSEATEGEIYFANRRLYETCGAEIVIAAIDTTGKLSMEDYVYTMFNDWGIGGDSYLGFLLVMAVDDDDYYAMTGTKLEGYLDAGTLQQMLDRYLEPDFAKKDYDAGARKFFEAVYTEIADQLNLNLSVQQGIEDYKEFLSEQTTQEENSVVSREVRTTQRRSGFGLGKIILLTLLVLILLHRRRPRRQRASGNNGFLLGWMMNSLLRNAQRPRTHVHFGGPSNPFHHGTSGSRPRNFGGSSSFGGSSRSSFGGSFRSSSSGSRSGFGGASRSGGGSRGPSTRGGGAGRGGRR